MVVYYPDIPPHVAEVIRHFPPDIKRSIKAAIRSLCLNPHTGFPLMRELDGYWKYRVRRFRIIYSIDRRRKSIRIVAAGHRRKIYEEVVEQIQHGK